jgi:uncharacterized protein (TIGR03067 family)
MRSLLVLVIVVSTAATLTVLAGPASFRADGAEKPTDMDRQKQLLGEWVGTYQGGKPISLTFGPENKAALLTKDGVEQGTYTLDLTKQPAHLDLDWRAGRPGGRGAKLLTIVEFLDGDRIRVEDNATGPRPSKFSENSIVLKKK